MPHEDMDRLLPQSRRSNHIVVASCNQFYILRLGQDPLDNPYRKDASSQLNESTIFDQLLRIYRISRENAKRELVVCNPTDSNNNNTNRGSKRCGSKIPRVGLFTSENRKNWARIHKKLSHCGSDQLQRNCYQQQQQQQQQQDSSQGNEGSCSPTNNTESLRLIEDCLFVMCLDSLVGHQQQHQQEATKKKALDDKALNYGRDELDVDAANIILTGGGSHLFTANRWFDKFLQIIVGRDGICGINIEHSASEGITVLRFLEEFLEFISLNPISQTTARGLEQNKGSTAKTSSSAQAQSVDERIKEKREEQQKFTYSESTDHHHHHHHQLTATSNACLGADSITSPAYVEPLSPSELLQESDKITPLCWTLNAELERAIDDAESRVNKLIGNFSLYILEFSNFGRSFIKDQNLSPDAFIQLALQYTFFKLHGFLVSTYESASLRQFRLGRVDNIRANTCEAYDWIKSMLACKRLFADGGETISWHKAEEAFIRAITKQVEILRYTIVGGGPDNHLLALKQLARIRYDDDELPDLFNDPSYKEFLNFRLSTSQLPNESGITVGYGAVTPDGYGCSYNPCSERIIFCISSFVDCPQTSSSKFASILKESLLEMQQLCLGRKSGREIKNKSGMNLQKLPSPL